MRPRAPWAGIGAFVLGIVLWGAAGAGATTFPPGFSEQVVAAGLTDPTAFAFFPDGRIVIAQKSGVVRIVKNGALLPTQFIDISDRVNDYWDHGLLGIAVDPAFPTNPHVFLLYTYENDALDYTGPKTARLTRVTVSGDTASPASEVVVLGTVVGSSCKNFPVGADCIPSDAVTHTIGAVKFGLDQTIFLTTGDGADFNINQQDAYRSLDLDQLAGKVLRITRTGQGVPTNPFWTGDASDNRSKVWASGLRNAYRFNVSPDSGLPYVGDVGWDNREEISVAAAGANLGWPCWEGSAQNYAYSTNPVCQALYGGAPQSLAATGTIIARVTAPTGGGAGLQVIVDGTQLPVGSVSSQGQYDSYDGNNFASEDWVGYTFTSPHTFNRLLFQEGLHFSDGGWFTSQPIVQVRQNNVWVAVADLSVSPAYPGNNGVSYETFTFTFDPIQGDGIRLYGAPGGTAAFISVGELAVFEEGTGSLPGGEHAVSGQATTVIARVPAPTGSGSPVGVIRDGDRPPVGSDNTGRQYDSYDGNNPATEDWVGYTFATSLTFSKLEFQEGMHFADGGFFAGQPIVQVRHNNVWVPVSNVSVSPAYPGNNGVSYETFTFTFDPIQGDGIRLYGAPGGTAAFISVGEVEVFADLGVSALVVTLPIYEYPHNSETAAVTAGTFYTGTVYPAQYQGAYFFGDFARGWLRTFRVDANDELVPGSVADFAEDADGLVAIEMGPGGLYYLAITANELRRIQYTAGNTPPTAVASANPTSGLAPLTVSFSSAGSNDPDGDPITFEWDFGDGSAPGSGASPQHTYTANGTYVATLTVRDNHGGAGTDTVTVTVGNLAPVATINTPAATLTYKVGDVIGYSGSATSSPQDPIPGATLTWQIVLHHCPGGTCHAHPFSSGSGPSGSFTIPDHGDESHFEIVLTATDGGGLSHTVSRTIQPQTVQVTLATTPTGLQVVYDSTVGTGPLVMTTIVGSTHTISAPSPQGTSTFVSWSDGLAQQHSITVSATNMTRTATFSGSNNLPPVASISSPAAALTFKVGDVVSYSGTATSQPQDAIPGATLTWQINLTHCPGGVCQTQLHASGTGPSGSFTVPNHGDGSSFAIVLTATDGGGLSHTVSRTIQPQTVQVTLATSPAGLQVTYDGITGTAPLVRTAVVGATRTINAPSPQGTNGFASWSDAGAQQHNVTVGAANVTYTASYSIACPVGQFRAQYYNNRTLAGNPVLTRCEAYPLNYNWGNGGPGSGVAVNNFSARWQGRFNFTAGSWTFTTLSDDGVRLWVDGVQLINFWSDHGPTTRIATLNNVTAGEHEVRIEYYERNGGAALQASWAGGGGGSVETNVTSQAQAVIAKVPAPLGGGGPLSVIRDGDMPPVGTDDAGRQYDSWDGNNAATEDWVGYTFATTRTFTKVVFQEGMHFWDGGFFAGSPTVQVRQSGTWVTVSNLAVTPAYAGSNGLSFESYTMTFSQMQGDGIRLYGVPGGAAQFISVGELEVFALVP